MAPKAAPSKRKGPAVPSPPTPLALYKRALLAIKSWSPPASETWDAEALSCLAACISQLRTRMGLSGSNGDSTAVKMQEAATAAATSNAPQTATGGTNNGGAEGAAATAAAAAATEAAAMSAELAAAWAAVEALSAGDEEASYSPVVRHNLDLDLDDWEEEPGFLLASAHMELGKLLGRMWPRRVVPERRHLGAALRLFPDFVRGRLALAQSLAALAEQPADLTRAEQLLTAAAATAQRLAGEQEEAGAAPAEGEEEEEEEQGAGMEGAGMEAGSGSRRGSDSSGGSHAGVLLAEANAACLREWEAGREAVRLQAMLSCQAGREARARRLLGQLGYSHRLARPVLHYPLDPLLDPTSASTSAPSASPSLPSHTRYCAAVDGALPGRLLALLRGALAPGGSFWRQHGYGRVGYFSYMHELGSPCLSAVHDASQLLHRLVSERFPAARGARFAEWWAHCRPHPSGHQLHFDSDDEGHDGVRNPFVSCVIYLTGGVGGPTLVTPQVLGGPLAPHGWLIYPRDNRVGMFDAAFLHGVIPGRGASPRPGEHRITLMVAFWKELQCRPRTDGLPGPSQPFPTTSSSPSSPAPSAPSDPPCRYSWMSELPPHPEGPEGWGATDPRDAAPTPIDRVWERLDGRPALPGAVRYEDCFQGF